MTTRFTLALLPPLGHDAALYGPLEAALGDDVRVVTLDYPGFGAREGHFDYHGPRLFERLAEDAAIQLEDRGVLGGPYGIGGSHSAPRCASA